MKHFDTIVIGGGPAGNSAAIYAARNIQIMTSLQTGDYMPFQLNWITFVYMFAILNVLILVIRFLFIRKVKKIRDDNRQAEFLSEW